MYGLLADQLTQAPSNLQFENAGHRAVAEELLRDGNVHRLAGLRHGNMPLASPEERRYSVTQYCQGSLIRWAARGFRLSGSLSEAQKEALDREAGEGWEAQLNRFSTWGGVANDREMLREWEQVHGR